MNKARLKINFTINNINYKKNTLLFKMNNYEYKDISRNSIRNDFVEENPDIFELFEEPFEKLNLTGVALQLGFKISDKCWRDSYIGELKDFSTTKSGTILGIFDLFGKQYQKSLTEVTNKVAIYCPNEDDIVFIKKQLGHHINKKINISDNCIMINEDNSYNKDLYIHRYHYLLLTIDEYMQSQNSKSLFLTEDNKNIYIGMSYWVWDYGCLKNTNSEIHCVRNASWTHTGDGRDRKYFSTKEAAEQYRDNQVLFYTEDFPNKEAIYTNNKCWKVGGNKTNLKMEYSIFEGKKYYVNDKYFLNEKNAYNYYHDLLGAEVIEFAKLKFSIGSIVKTVHGIEIAIKHHNFFYSPNQLSYENQIIYFDGVWAKILRIIKVEIPEGYELHSTHESDICSNKDIGYTKEIALRFKKIK